MATQTVDQAPPSDDDYTGVLHTYVPYKAGSVSYTHLTLPTSDLV